MNREQPTSSMATTTVNKDGDHSWTYLDLPIQRLDQSRQLHGNLSMLFVIVAWLIVPVTATGLSSLKLRVQRWGLPVAHGKKMASSVHAISTWPEVCAGPSCLPPLTISHFSSYFVHFVSCVNSNWTSRHEPWTAYLLNGNNNCQQGWRPLMNLPGLTYSEARPIEATAWQSVDAVCHCCLTHSSCYCHWTQFS